MTCEIMIDVCIRLDGTCYSVFASILFHLLVRKQNLEKKSCLLKQIKIPYGILTPGSIFKGFKIPYDTRLRASGLAYTIWYFDLF
jgi:hypothetical protein